ncbi:MULTISPECIES: hypothetical protein [unclassified Nocardia]|uniref:hypothetical protein n=1 Tax=unclassified Nocardia TaxID=2637762 RepID=UPI001CE4339A|nr:MULTISPECIES: hypothetical protein [unclassified Nocardia]
MRPGKWPVSDGTDDQATLLTTLLAAFPAALADDVCVVAQMLPVGHLPLIENGCSVWVGGEHLNIPYRVCNPEPAEHISRRLSATQTKILHCLYSRHSDGYVRQRHLRQIINATDPWIVPYVVELVGEYVLDIVLDIKDGLTDVVTVETAQHEAYGRFAAANPEFLHLTSQRVTSYWNRYYRNRYPRRYYPGRIVIGELGEAAAAYGYTGDTEFRHGTPARTDRTIPINKIQFDRQFQFPRPRHWARAGSLPIMRRDRVIPRVDGVPLTDLIDRFELDAGMRPAGGAYGGLVPAYARSLRMDAHFHGMSTMAMGSKIPVLVCECGEWGCWPLLAEITVTDDFVIWDRIEQPYRPARDYTAFGPFRFKRKQYDRALRDLNKPISWSIT